MGWVSGRGARGARVAFSAAARLPQPQIVSYALRTISPVALTARQLAWSKDALATRRTIITYSRTRLASVLRTEVTSLSALLRQRELAREVYAGNGLSEHLAALCGWCAGSQTGYFFDEVGHSAAGE